MQLQTQQQDSYLNVNYRLALLISVMFVLTLLSCDVHAKDLLEGTMGDVTDTLNGVGKKWIILIDFAISLGAFAMTKKPFVFFSTLAVALAISGIGVMIK